MKRQSPSTCHAAPFLSIVAALDRRDWGADNDGDAHSEPQNKAQHQEPFRGDRESVARARDAVSRAVETVSALHTLRRTLAARVGPPLSDSPFPTWTRLAAEVDQDQSPGDADSAPTARGGSSQLLDAFHYWYASQAVVRRGAVVRRAAEAALEDLDSAAAY
jgi:hypothetical protein